MREAVICEPVRTPIGRYGGMFKSLTAVDLGVTALKGLIDRTGIAPEAIEDVILGHCNANSEAPAIGRVVALDAGLPVTVPGLHIDRRCGSGLQAVIYAAMQVQTGVHEGVVVIDTDEPPRADTSLESLGRLKPILLDSDPEATVTAGNASGQNDAAAMCIVTTPERAGQLGLRPLVRLVSWGVAGVAPKTMGIGPGPAPAAAPHRAALSPNH